MRNSAPAARTRATPLLLASLWSLVLGLPATATAAEELDADGVQAIVEVLREQGLVTEAQAESILARDEARRARLAWLDRITLFGDFRGRYEGFFYQEDFLGNERKDRNRLRYRLRLGLKAEVVPQVDVVLRFATGTVSTSRNQTLGSGNDFLPDAFNLDQAYLALRPFAGRRIPGGARHLDVWFGKMPNAFRSKVGKDLLIWDGDLTPEGLSARYGIDPIDGLGLTLTGAYYVIDENSSASDPHVIATQLRAEATPAGPISFGAAASYYAFRKLDDAFFARAQSSSNFGGNILNVDPGTGAVSRNGLTNDRSVDVGDLRAWLRYGGIEAWPVLLYGNVVHNFSAQNQPGTNADEEDLGFSVGLELGRKRDNVHVGVGYFYVEPNAVLANFTDSDVFDGRTNGSGWMFYAARQLFSNTDFKFELFLSDTADANVRNPRVSASGTSNPSLDDADRVRLRTDVVVKF
ncbi:MAG: putative porin [Proteobacteria bacterium]|nr:putative porin [Pseudomonadota bacterium]